MTASLSIVAGASSGLGRRIALKLSQRGEPVLLIGRSLSKLEQVKRETASENVYIHAADMSKASEAMRAFEYAKGIGLPITHVYCSLGDPAFTPIGEIGQDDVQAALNSNLISYVLCAQEAIRHFRESAGNKRLILILSTAAQTARPKEPLYTAAKWGARGFFLTLRELLKGTDIDVAAVYPGGMQTPFWDRDNHLRPVTDGFLDPDEVAAIILDALHSFGKAIVSELIVNRRG